MRNGSAAGAPLFVAGAPETNGALRAAGDEWWRGGVGRGAAGTSAAVLAQRGRMLRGGGVSPGGSTEA